MKCSWVSSAGAACDAEALLNDPDGRCWFHSDTVEDSRAEARSRGGRHRHRPDPYGGPVDIQVRLDTAEGILETLRAVAQSLADGKMDRARANGISFACSTATATLRAHRYEDRIKAIETRLGLREVNLEDEA